MAWGWRNNHTLRCKCRYAGNGPGRGPYETVEWKNDSSVMISPEGKADCHDKMLLNHKKIWTFFPIRAKYLPALRHQPLNGRGGPGGGRGGHKHCVGVQITSLLPSSKPLKSNGLRGLLLLVHILHIMLENSEKGYHMVKKACTMMHSLIDNWKPPPGTFRPGKPWSTVIPVHISTWGYECWIGIPLVRSCVFFSQDFAVQDAA